MANDQGLQKTVVLLKTAASISWRGRKGEIATLPIKFANDLVEGGIAIPVSFEDRKVIEDLEERVGAKIRFKVK